MKKKIIIFVWVLVLFFSCTSKKQTVDNDKFISIITSNDFGGASFQFYEMVTQKNEFNILTKDDEIKKYVKSNDIEFSNFIIVNLGKKDKKGYTIKIDKIHETENKVLIRIIEIPPSNDTNTESYPYFIVKINTKKEVEIQ